MVFSESKKKSIPIHIISRDKLKGHLLSNKDDANWVKANNYDASPGQVLCIPNNKGELSSVIFGKPLQSDPYSRLFSYKLPKCLPLNNYYFSNLDDNDSLPFISWAMGCYDYRNKDKEMPRIYIPSHFKQEITNIAESMELTMDLVNHPANLLNPDYFSELIHKNFTLKDCKINEIIGKELLNKNLPLIYEVGKSSEFEPRLLDISWGEKRHPKIVLIGKGVTFDTGGLDIKPSSAMLLMKKDMGGAANIIGLAKMIILNRINIQLRILIPIVENSISDRSFRPGDIIKSRSGLSIEVGNTDAEGRLILADAITLADEESPDMIIDMATLTGAARVALGPEIVAFYSTCDDTAKELQNIGKIEQDPIWQLPYFEPYNSWLNNNISDINNSPNTPFAGSIIAAEFLKRFVKNTEKYLHFDLYSWNNGSNKFIPKGGAAQGIRAIYTYLKNKYN
tara:strand:- start:78528 stop:79883 length:1356 start_codon:yes stop_codon:yes gene_type:complete